MSDKTPLLIIADADGDKCGEGCPMLNKIPDWALCNMTSACTDDCELNFNLVDRKHERSQYCLAAEAAAKELNEKVEDLSAELVALRNLNEALIKDLYEKPGLDDPVVKEAVEVAKKISTTIFFHGRACPEGNSCSEMSIDKCRGNKIDLIIAKGNSKLLSKALLRLAGEEE